MKLKILKKWWFWLIVILLLIILYFVLWKLNLVPMYQCGSSLGEQGSVNWCGWYKGIVVG